MDTADEISTATSDILDGALAKLRDTFPFMDPKDLEAIVVKASAQVQHDLRSLEPASTARKTRFDFNKLPAEIRVYIYELALARDNSDPFQVQDQHHKGGSNARSHSESVVPRTPFPTLLHINHQIREEALPVFYKQTQFAATFCVNGSFRPQEEMHEWLKLVGSTSAALISRFEVLFLRMNSIQFAHFMGAANVRNGRGRHLNWRTLDQLRKRDVVKALLLDMSDLRYDAIKTVRQESDDSSSRVVYGDEDGDGNKRTS